MAFAGKYPCARSCDDIMRCCGNIPDIGDIAVGLAGIEMADGCK